MLKVEKNLPIPQISRKRKRKTLRSIIETMKVGDSVLMPSEDKARHIWKIMRELGYKSTHRTVKGGCRVWRIQ